MEQVNIVTTIDGAGTIVAKNDLVTFTLQVKAKDDDLANAQSLLEEHTNHVFKEIEKLKSNGMKLHGEINTSISSYKLEHREGNDRVPAGYQSVNMISFTALVDDKLNEIHKVCMKLDKNMLRPLFSIKNRDVLMEQAIEKASTDAKETFKKECALLDINPNTLKILNWNFGYQGQSFNNSGLSNTRNGGAYGVTGITGPHGAMSSGGQSYSEPMISKLGSIYQELLDTKLIPGNVTVNVTVQVTYIWA